VSELDAAGHEPGTGTSGPDLDVLQPSLHTHRPELVGPMEVLSWRVLERKEESERAERDRACRQRDRENRDPANGFAVHRGDVVRRDAECERKRQQARDATE